MMPTPIAGEGIDAAIVAYPHDSGLLWSRRSVEQA